MKKAEKAHVGFGKKVLSVGLSVAMVSAFCPASQIQAFADEDSQLAMTSHHGGMSKGEAKEKVDAQADHALEEIGQLEYLSWDEVLTYKAQIIAANEHANDAIDLAFGQAAVKMAKDAGIDAIKDIVHAAKSTNRHEARDTNKGYLDVVQAVAFTEIDALSYLDGPTVADYKDDIAAAVWAGYEAIDDADSVEAIECAECDAKCAIECIVADAESVNLNNCKEGSSEAIDDEAAEAIAQIESLENAGELDAEEAAAYIAAIEKAQDTAASAIDGAKTTAGVELAEKTGVFAIDAIVFEAQTKVIATDKYEDIKALTAATTEALGDIDEMEYLTDTQKAYYKTQVIAEATEGAIGIGKASTTTEADAALSEAVAAIGAIDEAAEAANELAAVQVPAKAEIDETAQAAVEGIDDLGYLNDAEALVVKAEIRAAQIKADLAIDAAETPEAATAAKEAGLEEINAIVEKAEAANLLKAKIDNGLSVSSTALAYSAVIAALDGSLTDAQKATYVTMIAVRAAAAVDTITDATTVEEVEEAASEAKTALDGLLDAATAENLEALKAAAAQAINDQADEAIEAIEGLESLEAAGRTQAYIDAINEARDTALANIATANRAVGAVLAKQAGEAAIALEEAAAEVEDFALTKKFAIEEIHADEAEIVDSINALENLTDDQKQAYLDRVAEEVAKGIAAINLALTDDAIDEAFDNTEDALDAIAEEAQAEDELIASQNEANAEVAAAQADAIADVEGLDYLSDEDKADFEDQINAEQQKASEAIAAATTPDEVDAAKQAALDAINDIAADAAETNLDNAKEENSTQLDAAVLEDTDILYGLANLTDEQQADYLEQMKDVYEQALKDIDDAADVEGAETASADAIDAINAILESAKAADASARVSVYRLYNTVTGEHLYTTDFSEYSSLVAYNWNQENVAFKTNTQGGTAVYRLYNAGLGLHMYTSDAGEIETLTNGYGWVVENAGQPAFYSVDNTVYTDAVPVYRIYNPATSQHLLTLDYTEVQVNCSQHGWNDEGIAYYAFSA